MKKKSRRINLKLIIPLIGIILFVALGVEAAVTLRSGDAGAAGIVGKILSKAKKAKNIKKAPVKKAPKLPAAIKPAYRPGGYRPAEYRPVPAGYHVPIILRLPKYLLAPPVPEPAADYRPDFNSGYRPE